MSRFAFEKRPPRWLPKGPVPENDAEPDVEFSQLNFQTSAKLRYYEAPEGWPKPEGVMITPSERAESKVVTADPPESRIDGILEEVRIDTARARQQIEGAAERVAAIVTSVLPTHFADESQPPEEESRSDGSTASYYRLPEGATELQDLISYRNMNAQVGEMFRALYRYGLSSHSDKLRDAKKVLFYAKAEIERLEKYES